MTGLTDAAIDDFTVKAFIWSSLIVMAMMIIAYEFIVMETPKKPLLQAVLFILLSLSGLVSVHHLTWIFIWILLKGSLPKILWIAPNLYLDFTIYTLIMFILLIIYTTYLVMINILSCEDIECKLSNVSEIWIGKDKVILIYDDEFKDLADEIEKVYKERGVEIIRKLNTDIPDEEKESLELLDICPD
jgi:magnesium-transporting ATPase (P-type)